MRSNAEIDIDIDIELIRAFEDERARGVLGQPGSMWDIGTDGMARLRAPNGKPRLVLLPLRSGARQ